MTPSDQFAARFAARLSELIDDRGLRLHDVIASAGLSQNVAGAISGGRREPTLREAMVLAKALGVSLDVLCEGLLDFEWEGE